MTRKSARHQQPGVETFVQQVGREERETQLRNGRPQHGWTDLSRVESAHGQRLRDDQGGREQAEAEGEDTESEDEGVPFAEEREIHQWIRPAQTANRRAQEEEDPGREQRGEHAGAPPVEPLSLVERGEQQREAGAGVQESGEARCRSRRPRPRRRRNAVVDARRHERRRERGRPEHPLPRQVIPIEAVQRWRKVHGALDTGRIQAERERQVSERNVLQREAERQRIKRPGAETGNRHQEDQHADSCGRTEGTPRRSRTRRSRPGVRAACRAARRGTRSAVR